MRQLLATHHQFAVVHEDRTNAVRQHVLVLVAALAEEVQEQNRPLPKVADIFIESRRPQLADLARQFLEHFGCRRGLERDRGGNGLGHCVLLLLLSRLASDA